MFTREDVTEALLQVIAEKGPNYVYPHAGGICSYSEDGQPSCIVGHVMAALDPEGFEKVVRIEEATGLSGDARDVLQGRWEKTDWGTDDVLYDVGSHTFTEDEALIRALSLTQSAQDVGHTWGEAYVRYEEVLALPHITW